MSIFYVPTEGAEDWRQLLADPDKHWRKGFSARTLAYCWESSNGDWPDSVGQLLRRQGIPLFASARPLVALPEHRVPLPGGGRASQTDIWVLATSGDQLISIAVEGKVQEPFGDPVATWLEKLETEAERRGTTSGARTRIDYLAGLLGLPEDLNSWGDIRYQLVHRTASAVLEAKRFTAGHALMLVHAFEATEESRSDFSRFVEALGGGGAHDELIQIGERGGVDLWLAWCAGEPEFLSR